MKQIFDYLQSFAVIGLVLAGIGGLSYHMFKEDGWVESALGDIWDMGVQYPLIAIPVIIGAIVFGNMWRHDRLAKGRHSKLPDLFIYVLMAAGVVFIGRLFLLGTF